MKRLVLAAPLCAAILLLAAPLAVATPLRAAKAEVMRPARAAAAPLPAVKFVPLTRRLIGTATVTADVYNAAGGAMAYGTARLVVWADDGTLAYSQTAATDGWGHVTFTGVPAASSAGEIACWPPTGGGDFVYDVWDLSWTDPEGASFVLRPGYVPVTLVAGGIWKKYFSYSYIDAFSSEAGASKLAETGIARASSTAGTTYGTALALGGTLDCLNAYFFSDEGVEVETSGATVTPGATGGALTVSEAEAQRIYNPTWASGKPGSAFRVRFNNFPTGWVNRLTGDDTATARGVDKSYGTWTSAGTGWQARTVTIPRSATPGYTFRVWAQHANGAHGDRDLALSEPFQVCTLIPSENPVAMYHKLIFSGKVPFQEGRSKTVSLYRRFTAAGQPPYAGGFKSYGGWTRIATTTANGVSGKYVFPRIWPKRTAWYCVWYPKDKYHWGAWTSVVKVVKK